MNKKIKKNKTNKKYRKTRKIKSKNKRDKKNKKGGKIGDDINNRRIRSIVVTLTASEMKEKTDEFLGQDEEVCGVYVLNRGEANILTSPIHYTGERDHTGRAFCITPEKYHYAIIWHVHPFKCKFYPSVEDILIIIGNNQITNERVRISIIYTSLGVWILKSLDNAKFRTDTQTKLREISDKFYWGTNSRGRMVPGFVLDKKVIDEYTRSLLVHGIEVVLLKNYSESDYQIELNNVREDAIYGWSPPAPPPPAAVEPPDTVKETPTAAV